jgi:hypothetical protein
MYSRTFSDRQSNNNLSLEADTTDPNKTRANHLSISLFLLHPLSSKKMTRRDEGSISLGVKKSL